ncbi:MAG: ATP-binding protein [Bryobacterales bacterium]
MEKKSQRFSLIFLGLTFLVLVGISFWHTSLDFGDFRPGNAAVGWVLWGLFTLVGLGVFALGFILFRDLLKLYVERRRGQLGSKIRAKLVGGALALSLVPVIAMVIFSFTVLSRTFDKWLFPHTREILAHSEAVTAETNRILQEKSETDAAWIAATPEAAAPFRADADRAAARAGLAALADRARAQYVGLLPIDGSKPILEIRTGDLVEGPVEWKTSDSVGADGIVSGVMQDSVWAIAPVRDEYGGYLGRVAVAMRIPQEIQERRAKMEERYAEYRSIEAERTTIKYFYLSILALITIFVLFVAVWLSLFLSRQISRPIEALVAATAEVSSGHLDYRVEAPASDELAGLVLNFNQMTQELEQQTRRLQQSNRELEEANAEIDSRRRLINAILENITPGVLSIDDEGAILKINPSVAKMFRRSDEPRNIADLFEGEDLEEIRYMLNRARRIGSAAREFEVEAAGKILHLAVAVSAIERPGRNGAPPARGFVVVIEDTTDLLRAQKSAAWNEVARRVAHEIKNPLTPIALSAERMERLLDRMDDEPDANKRAQMRERFTQSTRTIAREVETLRRLVDEFSQMARFPKADPRKADLNEVVREALHVFEGRLEGVTLRVRLGADLPLGWIDPEQFKRVVINLVDNAAEAVSGAYVREIEVSTAPGHPPDLIELAVSDSGPGISPEDKEKLFLPYFSTKNRGTGLGLAIVSRIVTEHGGTIRVEDNRPSGSRFLVETPVAEPVSGAFLTPVGASS